MLIPRALLARARSARRRSGCGLGALVLTTACASPGAPQDAGTPASVAGPVTTALVKAAPRWVGVASLSGAASQQTAGFEIRPHVLQWRVTATCHSGHLRVAEEGEAEPLIDTDCPTRAFGFSIRTGDRRLEVVATDRWEAVVEEQVDEPLAEPPLAGMTGRARLATGTFFDVEQEGTGTATLYRLAGGGQALRLDPFLVTANDDLFVWVSEAAAPRTSAEALFAPHVQLEPLRATAGSQNYRLPDSLPLDRIRSIVIWCEPVRTAYAAAALVEA